MELAEVKKLLRANPDVTSVGRGFRYRRGVRKIEECIVVGVKRKRLKSEVLRERLVPAFIENQATDVQEKTYRAFGHVGRMRPCPAGFSIGHPRISAGTLGAWVKRGSSDDWLVLSNNHVLAASNEGLPNDIIIQPGKADGGFSGSDAFARLREYVNINFGGGDKKKAAAFLWKAWSAPAHLVAKLFGCSYRLRAAVPFRIEQPDPNLVDAALAKPMVQGYVELDPIGKIGKLKGLRDLQLGDEVRKVGRTTEYTEGMVTVVDLFARLSYGASGIAAYDDQLEIRSDSGEFSAGGDSGSAIVSEDGYLGGLLFAGGGGATIANRIGNVVALLGVRI